MKLGELIRKVRKEKGLKGAEFAQLVGITGTYLSLIEHGHKTPGKKLLNKIARKLDNVQLNHVAHGDPVDYILPLLYRIDHEISKTPLYQLSRVQALVECFNFSNIAAFNEALAFNTGFDVDGVHYIFEEDVKLALRVGMGYIIPQV